MTSSMAFVPCVLVAVLAIGCKSTPDNSVSDAKQREAALVQLAKAKADAMTTIQVIAEYSYTKKSEFVATMKRDVLVLQDDLDRLSARADRTGGTAKADAKAKLDIVRDKLSQTKNLLAQVESATESTWNGATGGFRQSYADLRESIEGARKWLGDAIAP